MPSVAKVDLSGNSTIIWLIASLGLLLADYIVLPTDLNTHYLPGIFFCLTIIFQLILIYINPAYICNPLFWFLITASLYYGVGALFYAYGGEYSVEYLFYYNYVSPPEMGKVNTICCFAVLCATLGFYLAGNLKLSIPDLSKPFPAIKNNTRLFAVICFVIGWGSRALAKLMVLIKGEEYIMPGIIYNLAVFCYVPIFILGILFFKGQKNKTKWIFYGLILIEIFYGVTTKSKTDIIVPVVVGMISYYLTTRNIRNLIISGMMLILVYVMVIRPFITITRITQGMGRDRGINISQSILSMKEYVTNQESSIGNVDFSKSIKQLSPLIRFSLWNAQAFALKEYDEDRPGETVEKIIYTPVPRVIWQDKPIMTMGHYWTPLVTGSDKGGGTGPGYIFELYWNGGVFLVAMGMLFIGGVFYYIGQINMRLISAGHFFWVPVFVLSFLISYNQEGWFAPSFGGFIVNAIFLYLFLIIIDRLILLLNRTLRYH